MLRRDVSQFATVFEIPVLEPARGALLPQVDGILDWWRSVWQGGLYAAVDAITPVWWMIASVAGFGLGFLTSGRVDFGSTLAAGCFVAGVADWAGTPPALQLALVPSTSILLTGAFAWRIWARRPRDPAPGALVPGEVAGCTGVVVDADESDPRRLRVRLDGRHEWSAVGVDGVHLPAGTRVRVLSRERSLLLVDRETGKRT